MGLFSFFKKGKEKAKMKCDWCGQEMESPPYTKHIGCKTFYFCSESCKKEFRKSGKGKGVYRRCPTCPMAPKSWG